jgi:aryl-alcohol dehydrogenase-like predicted oxidoreductase
MPASLPHIALPGTGHSISRVGLGGMLLSIDGRPDRDRAKTVVRAAVEAGITLIDTADAYCLDDSEIGHNESLISEALAEIGLGAGDDSRIVVATKGGNTRPGGRWVQNGRPDHLRAACHASLRALRVERISLYQLHVPDRAVPFADSVGELARLRKEGKVAAVGLSNVSVQQIREAEAITPISSVQNYCSAWDVGYRRSPIIEHCAERGIVFFAYSPLGGRGRSGRLSESDALTTLARELGASPQQLALAWLLGQAPVVVPIPSATRGSSIESSARAASLELDARATRRLAKALRHLPGSAGLFSRVLSTLRGAAE